MFHVKQGRAAEKSIKSVLALFVGNSLRQRFGMDATVSKPCKVCGLMKPITSFQPCGRQGHHRSNRCNSCAHKARPPETPEQRDRRLARRKKWKKKNRDRVNKYERALRQKRGRQQHNEHVKALRLEIRRRKKEAHAAIMSKPWNAKGLSRSEKWTMRYKLDPEFAINQRLRSSMRRKLRGKSALLTTRLRSAMKDGKQLPMRWRGLLPYTPAELKVHLEKQFSVGMTWAVFCEGKIDIDHIRPLSMFDLSDPDEFLDAWSLPNLRPMWGADNRAKGAKRTHLL